MAADRDDGSRGGGGNPRRDRDHVRPRRGVLARKAVDVDEPSEAADDRRRTPAGGKRGGVAAYLKHYA